MAVAATTRWDVRVDGDATFGAGFNPSNANMPTDLAATVANTGSPVVTSASYTFVAGDVGHYLYVKSGSNWTAGWYPIASVNAGAATLSAAIGAGVLASEASANTVAGCATVASPTGGTFTIDYSRGAAAILTLTDAACVTAATTLTSTTGGFTKAMIGNYFKIASGTNSLTEFFEVVNQTDTNTITIDRTCASGGDASAINMKVGGSQAAPENVEITGGVVAGNIVWIEEGSYTKTSTRTLTLDGNLADGQIEWWGYADGGARIRTLLAEADMPVFTTATNGIVVITLTGALRRRFVNIKVTSTAATRGNGWQTVTTRSDYLDWVNCVADGLSGNWHLGAAGVVTSNMQLIQCVSRNSVYNAGGGLFYVMNTGAAATFIHLIDCLFDGGASGHDGLEFFNGTQSATNVVMVRCIVTGNQSSGIKVSATTGGGNTILMIDSVIYGNGADGIEATHTTSLLELILVRTAIYGNTGRGVNFTNTDAEGGTRFYHCGFGDNDAGNFTNIDVDAAGLPTRGTGNYLLTSDPFVDAAGGNFTPTVAGQLAQFAQTYPFASSCMGAATPEIPTPATVATAVWAYADRSLTG